MQKQNGKVDKFDFLDAPMLEFEWENGKPVHEIKGILWYKGQFEYWKEILVTLKTY